MTTGRVNPANRLEEQGISGLGRVYYNLREPALIEEALKRSEGTLGKGGAFLVTTGKHTGRSPKDKFVVRSPSVEDTIWWDNNKPMDP
ncbi:MAG: phosphoenolpyruvate carboxykinase (ATP), partial [Rhodobacteraceae bacterium]|nr:phosphoenolpyruvate carboxykinase (ATP) [Paracoccaceae bacterium]